jgi:2-hydroxychromene-2-carboxylate isomerase
VSHPVFFYDLTDPVSYLAAERINAALAVVAEWEPVLGAGGAAIDREVIAARARQLGLQPLRWPPTATGREAALAATYAKQVGRSVAFSLAAFRQTFAGGHDLDLESTVLLAGAACELHPRALLQAIQRPAIGAALERACERARIAGATSLPAIEVRGSLFSGDDAVEQAAAHMNSPEASLLAPVRLPAAPQGSVADR